VIVVDSVAALVPRAELDGEMGDSLPGLQARLMSQALRQLTAIRGAIEHLLYLYQSDREKIGVMFGSPKRRAAVRALKFYSSLRLDIRRIGAIKTAIGSSASHESKSAKTKLRRVSRGRVRHHVWRRHLA